MRLLLQEVILLDRSLVIVLEQDRKDMTWEATSQLFYV